MYKIILIYINSWLMITIKEKLNSRKKSQGNIRKRKFLQNSTAK